MDISFYPYSIKERKRDEMMLVLKNSNYAVKFIT